MPELDPNFRIAQEVETEEVSGIDLSVYPNPARDYLNFVLDRTEAGDMSIYLSDIQGKKVADFGKFSLEEGINDIEVDIANIKSGIYFLHLSIEGNHKTLKVLKNE